MDENQSQSESHVNLNIKLKAAFSKAQGKFRAPKLNRTAKVFKEFKLLYETHYADLGEQIDCIREPLATNGLSFTHTTQQRGNAWFLVLELMHESGESIETLLPLNVNQTNQQLGATLTYLKRYQLGAFFGLAADFDDDGNATEGNQVEFGNGKKPELVPKKPVPKRDELDQTPVSEDEPETLLDKLVHLAETKNVPHAKMSEIIKLCIGRDARSKELNTEELMKVINYVAKFI